MLKASNEISSVVLDSGLCIILSDETRHYFGGYYHVKILARCNVPLDQHYFDDEAQHQDALEKWGDSVCFERVLEKMAVAEEDIKSVKNQLVDTFNATAISYLSLPDFARRFVRNEYKLYRSKSTKKFNFKDI